MKTRHIAPTLLVLAAFACSKEQPPAESPESSEPQPTDAAEDAGSITDPPGEPQPSGPAGQAPSPTPMQKQGPDERLQHGGGVGGTGGMGGMGGGVGGGTGGTKSPIRR